MNEQEARREYFRKLGLSEYCFKVTKDDFEEIVMVYSDSLVSAVAFLQSQTPELEFEFMGAVVASETIH